MDCDGSRAQWWSHAVNTFQALGKCLDVMSSGTANGTQVQLYGCNGSNAQDWTVSGGRLVNVGSGTYLEAAGVASTGAARLEIWDCAGGANQQWVIH